MNKRIITVALALMLPVLAMLAQAYKGRAPTAAEQRRIAGLTFYPQDSIPSDFLRYSPSNYQVFPLVKGWTNNVIFGSIAPTNVFVVLPSPTNSQGASFTIVSGDRVSAILTNANSITFSDPTNVLTATGGIWTMRTNTAVRVFTPTGTNWFVLPIKM